VELVALLEQTFNHAQGVIDRVDKEHHDNPTPCSEWSVRDLLGHMIGVVAAIGSAAAETPSGPFELSDDPAGQFKETAAAALAAWRAPGALDKIVDAGAGPMPGHVLAGINVLDTAAHTWDLATATDQPAGLPDDLVAGATELSRQIVTPQVRPGRFADAVDAPADATPTQQLVAFLGRTP
jgi:uncharacterized protein (TIGR03086 family)